MSFIKKFFACFIALMMLSDYNANALVLSYPSSPGVANQPIDGNDVNGDGSMVAGDIEIIHNANIGTSEVGLQTPQITAGTARNLSIDVNGGTALVDQIDGSSGVFSMNLDNSVSYFVFRKSTGSTNTLIDMGTNSSSQIQIENISSNLSLFHADVTMNHSGQEFNIINTSLLNIGGSIVGATGTINIIRNTMSAGLDSVLFDNMTEIDVSTINIKGTDLSGEFWEANSLAKLSMLDLSTPISITADVNINSTGSLEIDASSIGNLRSINGITGEGGGRVVFSGANSTDLAITSNVTIGDQLAIESLRLADGVASADTTVTIVQNNADSNMRINQISIDQSDSSSDQNSLIVQNGTLYTNNLEIGQNSYFGMKNLTLAGHVTQDNSELGQIKLMQGNNAFNKNDALEVASEISVNQIIFVDDDVNLSIREANINSDIQINDSDDVGGEKSTLTIRSAIIGSTANVINLEVGASVDVLFKAGSTSIYSQLADSDQRVENISVEEEGGVASNVTFYGDVYAQNLTVGQVSDTTNSSANVLGGVAVYIDQTAVNGLSSIGMQGNLYTDSLEINGRFEISLDGTVSAQNDNNSDLEINSDDLSITLSDNAVFDINDSEAAEFTRVRAKIDGASEGNSGKINLNGQFYQTASIGETVAVETLEIFSSGEMITQNKRFNVENVVINNSGVLKIGSTTTSSAGSSVTGTVRGFNANNGIVRFISDYDTGSDNLSLGTSVRKLNQVVVDSSLQVSVANSQNHYATTFKLESGIDEDKTNLQVSSSTTLNGEVILGDDSRITIDSTSAVNGEINADASVEGGKGELYANGTTFSSNIGDVKLARINITETVDFENISVASHQIDLNNDSSARFYDSTVDALIDAVNVGGGTLLSSGSTFVKNIGSVNALSTIEFIGDSSISNSSVSAGSTVLKDGSITTLNSVNFNSDINSQFSFFAYGELRIQGTTTLGTASEIGSLGQIDQVSVIAGANFTANSIYSVDLDLAAGTEGNITTLTLRDDSILNISGLFTTASNTAVNLGEGAQITLTTSDNNLVEGTMTIGAGSSFLSGKLNIAGELGIGANSIINGDLVLRVGSQVNLTGNASLSSSDFIGHETGVGSVSIAEDAIISITSGNIGTESNTIGTLTLAEGAEINYAEGAIGSIYAESIIASGAINMRLSGNLIGDVSLSSTGSVTLYDGDFTSIKGSSNGVGSLTLSGFRTIGSDKIIGAEGESLALLTISNGVEVTSQSDIYATNVSIGNTSSGLILDSAALFGNVKIDSDGRLKVTGTGSTVSGTILSFIGAGGTGRFDLDSSTLFTATNDIGSSSRSLALIFLNGGSELTFDNGSLLDVYATEIVMGNNAVLNINDASVNGLIKSGSTSAQGIVNYDEDNQLRGNIGTSSNKISEININGVAEVSQNTHNIYVSELNINNDATFNIGSGTTSIDELVVNDAIIDFGASSRTLTGNLTSISNARIVVGSAVHNIIGNLSLSNNTSLEITVNSISSAGGFNVSSAATILNGTTFNLSVDLPTIRQTGDIDIVESADGAMIEEDFVINVNESGTNIVDSHSFTLVKTDNNLTLRIVYTGSEAPADPDSGNDSVVSSDPILQKFYDTIVAIDNTSGALATVKDYITDTDNSNADKEKILKQLSVNNIGLNQNSFAVNASVIASISNRIDTLRQMDRQNVYDLQGNKTSPLDVNNTYAQSILSNRKFSKDFLYSNTNQLKIGTWIQALRSTAKQADKTGFVGYNADLSGISFGADIKPEKDLIIGAGIALATSKINAQSVFKNTGIDIYQLNFYTEKNFGNLYLDAFLSGAINKYSSNRKVDLTSTNASAEYQGYTYSAKLRTGYNYHFNDFEFYPELNLTYAYNKIDDYTEKNGGTLILKVEKNDAEMFEIEPAIGFGYKMSIKKKSFGNFEILPIIFNPRFKLSYGYDVIGNRQVSNASFIGQTTNFITETSKINRGTLRASTGLNFYSANSVSVGVNYLYEHKKTYHSHTGLVKFRYEF